MPYEIKIKLIGDLLSLLRLDYFDPQFIFGAGYVSFLAARWGVRRWRAHFAAKQQSRPALFDHDGRLLK